MKKRMSLLTLSPYYSRIQSPFVYLSLTTVTNSFATAFASSSPTHTPPPTPTTTSENLNAPQTPLSKICIVGGTHGNEYTGVWTIKSLARQLPTLTKRYPSLSISTLLGNPAAFQKGTRFVDVDLNRQFTRTVLLSHDTASEDELVEIKRAQELNRLLGPKFPTPSHPHPPRTDVILDLHTTTANVGATLIIPEGDVVAALCAAYAVYSCAPSHDTTKDDDDNEARSKCKPFELRIVLHTHPNRQSRPNLPSIAKHGWTVEVGPVPTSIVRDDANRQTRRIVESLLECLELWNTRGEEYIRTRLEKVFATGRVPCFRSMRPQSQPPTTQTSGTQDTVTTMSSKIAWPSSESNPNFPEWVIDQSVQDRDFTLPISQGDVLFRDLDGGCIRYDGRFGSPIRLMFVNEAGYYLNESGTGVSVVDRKSVV